MTPLESAFIVTVPAPPPSIPPSPHAPLSNQLPQVQPSRQTLPWHEIRRIHQFKVITVAFKSHEQKEFTSNLRILNEQGCPISRWFTTSFIPETAYSDQEPRKFGTTGNFTVGIILQQ